MFNSFISIIINVIFLLFDLNIFSWLHISQINTEMFLIFFKFMGFTLQNHKRGRETKRVKKKKKGRKIWKFVRITKKEKEFIQIMNR